MGSHQIRMVHGVSLKKISGGKDEGLNISYCLCMVSARC